MEKLNKNKVGLSLGIIFLLLHLIWILAVMGGFAEIILAWWNSSHFINMDFTITTFKIITAALTLFRAFIGGYLIGWLFAFIYNKLNN